MRKNNGDEPIKYYLVGGERSPMYVKRHIYDCINVF